MQFCRSIAIAISLASTSLAERPTQRPVPDAAARATHLAELRKLYAGAPSTWPAPTLDAEVEHRELVLLPAMPYPEDNPHSVAKAALGKQLFFDPRLSGSRQIACASCHDPDLGWGDGRAASFGHDRKPLNRNAPSILNSGYRTVLFWDGRAKSLEDQAHKVLTNQDEMHSSDAMVVEAIAALPGYVSQFTELFGAEGVTHENALKALATFERSLVTGRSRFDQFLKGKPAALSDSALAGLHLFRTDARCLNCHNGPLMTDDKFHGLGLANLGRPFEDLGRFAVTQEPTDAGKFRTPSLRNVTRSAPYMHSGLFDLAEILRLYNSGMRTERIPSSDQRGLKPEKSPHLKPLNLNDEDLADLSAFLDSLSEPHRRIPPPELP